MKAEFQSFFSSSFLQIAQFVPFILSSLHLVNVVWKLVYLCIHITSYFKYRILQLPR